MPLTSHSVPGALCGSSSGPRPTWNFLKILTLALTGIALMKDILSPWAPPFPLILHTTEGETGFQLGANPQPRKLREDNSTVANIS